MEKIEERKIVPVAAMISAGKSKLLNVILNINFLESKEGIGTKFVNILRYNPNINEPKFYHLKIKFENEKYIFYKDPEYIQKIGENDIIEENKKINKDLYNSTKIDYNDIFYMTEINSIGFIKNKNYMLTHDLCDIPGLSEYQEQNKVNKEEKEVLKKEDLEEKLKKGQEFGLNYTQKEINNSSLDTKNKKVEKKDEDEIFYSIDIKDESSYITEIYKRIKDYIDGAIIVLSIDNYYFNQNIEIIAKLHKVIQKRIKNFLIILNKMDLSTDPKSDIEKCKGFLFDSFPKCQTFNLNINTFIPISTLQIQNELLMNKSFNYFIKYHFYNFKRIIMQEKLLGNSINGKTFIDHLKDILKGMQGITKQDIENKIDELNNRDEIPQINKEIKLIIKELNDNFNGEYDLGIKEEDIDKEDDDEDFLTTLSSSRTSKTQDKIDDLEPESIIKMFYILQEKQLLIPRSTETEQLLNYFSIKTEEEDENEDKKLDKTISNIELNNQIIDALKLFYDEFKTSCTDISQIQYLSNEVQKLIEYLNIYDVIFVPFLGESNAGKSTIINGIIGRDLLPCEQKECTKRGILIRYSDEENVIKKADLIEEDFSNKKYYFFEAKDVIGKGDEKIKQTLNGLNYRFNRNEEDSFYYIKTKIKLFDDLGFDKSLKEMIYLIDLPGIGTGEFFGKKIYNKFINICNSFIFVHKNSVVRNQDTKSLFDCFIQAEESKSVFFTKFIKSSLFIFNQFEKNSSTEDEIEKVKDDIQRMIKGIDKNELKICFYNSKDYFNYCSIYNYFSDWGNTMKNEYEQYKNMNSSFFKNPKTNESNISNTFPQHLLNLLINKVKLFNAKIKKNQKFEKKIEENINKYFEEIGEDKNKDKNNIIKLVSFCRENLDKLNILNNSNIKEFKDIFKNQILYVNDSKQKELRESIYNILSTLDMFFGKDFVEKKKDIEEINNFKKKMNDLKDEIKKLIQSNIEDNLNIIKRFKGDILCSLYEKRQNLEELLGKNDYKEIVKQINIEMEKNVENLLKSIKDYLEKNDLKCLQIFVKMVDIINSFKDKKIDSFTKYDFKSYLSIVFSDGKKDLNSEIMNEIRSRCESLSDIFEKKGFKEWFCSFFSSFYYLQNVIDMIVETYTSKIGSFLKMIENESNKYLNQIIEKIDNYINSSTMEFSDIQKKKWIELCDKYEKTKVKIMEIEKKI